MSHSLLLTNIGALVGIDQGQPCLHGAHMAHIQALNDAWLLCIDGKIADFGTGNPPEGQETCDCHGGTVLPSFCDPHTHLVYAGSREGEFVDKINGLTYAQIARRGGGILNSADLLHDTSEDELYQQSMQRVAEIMRKGTGAVEIKSGYGLNTADELKMLRVIRRIRETTPLIVRSTLLGAHAVGRPWQGRQSDYVDMVVSEMIPEVGRQGLADFVDVFCDQGFFTPHETARILQAAAKWGMRPKIHAQELADSGGVDVAVAHHALSVDHLESMTTRDIEHLLNAKNNVQQPVSNSQQPVSNSQQPAPNCQQPAPNAQHQPPIPTLLPGTSFFLNMPYAPARNIIAAGLPLALATDYNPGSTPSGDMKFVVSLACIKMRLTPAEAINAATLNAAAAMDVSGVCGSIARGKVASLIVTHPIPSIDYIPYAYTSPIIRQVVLNGEVQE